MPPKGGKNAIQEKVSKKVDDKTFGMKNKNKSKQVQAKIQQMHKGGGNNPEADQYDKKARPFAAHPRVRLRPSSRRRVCRLLCCGRRRSSRRLPRTRWTWSSSRRPRRRVRSRGPPRRRARRRRRTRSPRSATSTSTFGSRSSKTVRRGPASCPGRSCPCD